MAAFDTVEQARVLQFRANVTQLFQQKNSRLRGLTREESLTGKAHFFERLDKLAAVKKTLRHADTVVLDPQHSRRMVVPVDYVWNALVDQQDKIRLLIDPNSEYAIAAANALRRAWDDEVIVAFDSTANGGEDGSTAVTFASEKAGDEDFSAAAITTPNILTIKKDLDVQEADLEERYLVYDPTVMFQLLKASTAPIASSADYNSIKALVNGDMDTWCGFKWVMSNRLTAPTGTTHFGYAWQKMAMGVALNADINARLSERPDKDYAVQTYASMTMGATRIQGSGVVRFKTTDTN